MSNDLTTGADPAPDPQFFGWGDSSLNVAQNLGIETSLLEALPNVKLAKDASGASGMLPKIEEMIRKRFKFDSGWNCMTVENIVYRLGAGKTLMVPQNMGNCVGNSHACLLASRIAHEVLALGDAEEPLGFDQLGIPFMPYSYGVGRWVGGMLGPGDGSYCGAQMEGTQKYGFLPCFAPGLDRYDGELPQGSTAVGRLFGRSKAEIQKWVPAASQFDLLEAPKARSAEECYQLIAEKQIPLQICSGVMPKYWKYDDRLGIPLYRMGTPASHSTQLMGAITIKGSKLIIGRNQWGYQAHKGAPEIDVPGGCYVFPIEELERWFRQGCETIGVGAIQGLESNPGA